MIFSFTIEPRVLQALTVLKPKRTEAEGEYKIDLLTWKTPHIECVLYVVLAL